MFKQPLAGIVATTFIIAISMGFISLFDFTAFTGWASFLLMCLIPTEIMIGVFWGCSQPNFINQVSQPLKGLYLILFTLVGGAVMGSIMFFTVGGGMGPPLPMLVQCTITAVIIMFWACIMMGGWPFNLIKNPIVGGIVLLISVYIINYLLFRTFFHYDFLIGAPIYVEALDPRGLYDGWYATVFYVTCIAMMFFVLHFDLWPLTKFPGIMQQPLLGIIFTLLVLALGSLVFYLGVVVFSMDVVVFLVTIPIPFIFGTIIVLNMMQDSLFSNLTGPIKGVVKVILAMVIGTALAQLFGMLAPTLTGEMVSGAPTYGYQIWLASALLGVTFPLLICLADYFQFGGLLKKQDD